MARRPQTPASSSATRRRSSGSSGAPTARRPGCACAGGERLAADAVVVTADLPVAYERLLPDVTRAAGRAQRPVLAVARWCGTSASGATLPDGAGHHNIHFGKAWDEAFGDLLDRGRADARPVAVRHRAVARTTRPPPPRGATSLYVLEPVPNLHVGRLDWDAEGPRAARPAARASSRRSGYPTDIVTEELVTPVDWQAPGHGGRHAVRAGPHVRRRPARSGRRTSTVACPGLVFAGSGTTPGVGIPMVLVSGQAGGRSGSQEMRR